MQRRPQKTPQEIEEALLVFELTERRVRLASQLVLLAVTLAFAVVAILCTLHGSPWPLSAGSGGSSGLTAAVASLGQRR